MSEQVSEGVVVGRGKERQSLLHHLYQLLHPTAACEEGEGGRGERGEEVGGGEGREEGGGGREKGWRCEGVSGDLIESTSNLQST